MANHSQLKEKAVQLSRKITDSINSSLDYVRVLEACDRCCYIKSKDGQLLLTNSIFESVFANGVTPIGRYDCDYLKREILATEEIADQLLLRGATVIEFEQILPSENGLVQTMHTVKISLIGQGHPTFAILGITEFQGTSSGLRLTNSNLSLRNYWKRYQALDEFDKRCTKLLVNTLKVKDIANELSVSTRTVEKHRQRILEQFEVRDVLGLCRLVCRLQDAGFDDFGVTNDNL